MLTARAEAEALRRSYCHLLLDLKPTHFITFNFGRPFTTNSAHFAMKGYFQRVERAALGRNWGKFTGEQRIVAIGFLEHLDSNPHWHVAARIPQKAVAALANTERRWKTLSAGGHAFVLPIEREAAVANYITKELPRTRHFDEVFIYSPEACHRSAR